MRYLTNVEATKTNLLIKAYQLSESEETKRGVLTELYGLWGKTISNFVWSLLGRSRYVLRRIETTSGLKLKDIEQEAFFGFRDAVETYKPTEAKFSTYLFIGIKHHLNCCLNKAKKGNNCLLWLYQMKSAKFNEMKGKVGFNLENLWQLHLDIQSYQEPLLFERKIGGEVYEQRYTRRGFSNKVLNTINARRFQRSMSLDSIIDSEEPADLSGWTPDQALEEKELTIKLENLLLSLLDNRSRLILTARYGLNFFPREIEDLGFEPGIPYNNAAIGRKIKLTKERVRQLKDKCLKRFEIKARRDVLKSVLDNYWFDEGSSVESD